jgi:D-arabinose 1-dehydrogenase-like Zn-dependent alcohol dehydrogenase
MLAFAAEHGIEAIVEILPMDRVNEAIARVRARAVPMALVLESAATERASTVASITDRL